MDRCGHSVRRACLSGEGKWRLGVLVVTILVSELVGWKMMYEVSALYAAMSDLDKSNFVHCLFRSMVFVVSQTLLVSLRGYLLKRLSLCWRIQLVDAMKRSLSCALAAPPATPATVAVLTSTASIGVSSQSSSMEDSSPVVSPLVAEEISSSPMATSASLIEQDGLPANSDQRLAQDSLQLADTLAGLVNTLGIVPFSVLFYSYYLGSTISWFVSLACFVYFIITASISWILICPLPSLVYEQGKLEGEFRAATTQFLGSWSLVRLIGSHGVIELRKLQRLFETLVKNNESLIFKQAILSISNNFSAYAATLVCYMIVGVPLLMTAKPEDSGSDRVMNWTRGTYVALSLLNGLTTLVESSTQIGSLIGLTVRVEEILRLHPSEETLPPDTKEQNVPSPILSLKIWFQKFLEIDQGGYTILPSMGDDLEGQNSQITSVLSHYKPSSSSDGTLSSEEELVISFHPNLNTSASDVSMNATLIIFDHFELRAPVSHMVLLPELSFSITHGMRLLIRGPSGCGKSTLLKLIATAIREMDFFTPPEVNIIDGQVHTELQHDSPSYLGLKISDLFLKGTSSIFICPQDPYLVIQGDVLDNVIYPSQLCEEKITSQNESFERARNSLVKVGLSALTPALHRRSSPTDQAESQRLVNHLSGGQRQCLVMARLLYNISPGTVALLDEVTSAMDEDTETNVYSQIAASCGTYISVAHRSSVRRFHTHELLISPNGVAVLQTIPPS